MHYTLLSDFVWLKFFHNTSVPKRGGAGKKEEKKREERKRRGLGREEKEGAYGQSLSKTGEVKALIPSLASSVTCWKLLTSPFPSWKMG